MSSRPATGEPPVDADLPFVGEAGRIVVDLLQTELLDCMRHGSTEMSESDRLGLAEADDLNCLGRGPAEIRHMRSNDHVATAFNDAQTVTHVARNGPQVRARELLPHHLPRRVDRPCQRTESVRGTPPARVERELACGHQAEEGAGATDQGGSEQGDGAG